MWNGSRRSDEYISSEGSGGYGGSGGSEESHGYGETSDLKGSRGYVGFDRYDAFRATGKSLHASALPGNGRHWTPNAYPGTGRSLSPDEFPGFDNFQSRPWSHAPEREIRTGSSAEFLRFSPGMKSSTSTTSTAHTYYTALAALMGKTIEELEQITGVKASVVMTLPEVAIFYQYAGYHGDYQVYENQNIFRFHLWKVFNPRLSSTAPHQKKKLRMKLVAGWIHSMNEHMVVLNYWTENGDPVYQALDYTFEAGRLVARQVQLPQYNEARGFFCFSPIFYYESTQVSMY